MVKEAVRQSHTRLFFRGWAVVFLADLCTLTAGFALNACFRSTGLWVLNAAAVLVYRQLHLLRNRKTVLTGENLNHLWGTANILSLARATMIALLAGFVFAPQPAGIIGWLPALLYTATAGLDFLDGYWARRHNTATRMGAVLDQEYDALGILVAAVLVVQWGRLPAAFLYLGAAKYLFSWGIGWRRLRGRPVYPLPPSRLRRRLAGFQMGILAVFLWPIARPPGTVLAELIIGIPLLLGFIRDWMLVSGAFDPEDQTYRKLKTAFHRIAETWLPLLLRAVLAAAAATTAAAVIGQAAAPASWIPAGVAQAGLLMTAYPGLRLALLALLVAGCFTSSVSMLLLLLEGLRIFITRLDPWAAAVVSATLLLFFSGPGPYRLALRRSARPAPGLVKR